MPKKPTKAKKAAPKRAAPKAKAKAAIVAAPAASGRSPLPPFRIMQPGIYPGIDLAAYHGDICKGLSVSASTLVTLHRSCPAKAYAHHYGNPEQIEEEDSAVMSFGTAAHVLILEGDAAFDKLYAVKPAGLSLARKDGRAWAEENRGREFVSAANFAAMRAMRDAIRAHPKAGWAFSEGRSEVTAAVIDAETGLWLKVRPDYLRPTLALNYKTARDAAKDKWQRQAWELLYPVAAAMTVDVLKQLGESVNYAFVIQEKTPPYLPAVRVLSDDFIQGGRMIYRRALQRFADCAAKGKWPGFDEIETVPLPAYVDRILANMESPT